MTPLIALRIYGPCPASAVAARCGLDLGSACDAIRKLRARGLATMTGGFRGGASVEAACWRLTTAGMHEFRWLHCGEKAATV